MKKSEKVKFHNSHYSFVFKGEHEARPFLLSPPNAVADSSVAKRSSCGASLRPSSPPPGTVRGRARCRGGSGTQLGLEATQTVSGWCGLWLIMVNVFAQLPGGGVGEVYVMQETLEREEN